MSWFFSYECKNACVVNQPHGLGSVLPGASAAPLAAHGSPVCGAEETGRLRGDTTTVEPLLQSKRWPFPCVIAWCYCDIGQIKEHRSRRASRCVCLFRRCRCSIIGLCVTDTDAQDIRLKLLLLCRCSGRVRGISCSSRRITLLCTSETFA